MAAIVTDQFRITNASNFINAVSEDNQKYYVFLGLVNPNIDDKFGRDLNWNTNVPSPVDNFQYQAHYRDTSLFGKKIDSDNIRRVVKKIEWTSNTAYDMYRHDYSTFNLAPNSSTSRLYNANYYVINSDFRVYICVNNGSSGSLPRGTRSLYEPTSTGTAPFQAGSTDDGYRWKYLFSIKPTDIIKFDSTEYIVLPNNWETSTDPEIEDIRSAGDSSVSNANQIKTVYIEDGGQGYSNGIYDIVGDGTGARVSITTTSGVITSAVIVNGGYGYTWGYVDLNRTSIPNPAKLIPIIPPSRGHGYDLYKELGADKVLIYARFDDSTVNFPINTQFSQIGILKDPENFDNSNLFSENNFSSLYAIKLIDSYSGNPTLGQEITQSQSGKTARGYIASYDSETKVLKYFVDRSLYFSNGEDQTDGNDISGVVSFLGSDDSTTRSISLIDDGGTIDIDNFNGDVVVINQKRINLEVTFTNGLANPQINKKTGEILYIDNRPLVERDVKQREDIKIILEF